MEDFHEEQKRKRAERAAADERYWLEREKEDAQRAAERAEREVKDAKRRAAAEREDYESQVESYREDVDEWREKYRLIYAELLDVCARYARLLSMCQERAVHSCELVADVGTVLAWGAIQEELARLAPRVEEEARRAAAAAEAMQRTAEGED